MYDYTISILEFLLTYLSWAYFLLICLQCAQFSHCASSFQNNNNNNNTALESSLDFFIPKYLSWFKKIRWSAPCILMHVQVILRIELLVHHKESSWIGNNTTCSPSYSCWMENSKHYQRIKLEPHGDAITTTAITMVKSMLDKLKETSVINDEDGRYNHD